MAFTLLPIVELLAEIGRYIAGSERSRLRQRRDLRDLDDRLLRDIGVTRREAVSGRRSPDHATGDNRDRP